MTEPAPTQVKYPWRATLRTALQILPSILLAIPLLVVAIEADNPGLTGAVGAGAVALAAIITRIMAVPQVNSFLTSAGLGAQPAPGRHQA